MTLRIQVTRVWRFWTEQDICWKNGAFLVADLGASIKDGKALIERFGIGCVQCTLTQRTVVYATVMEEKTATVVCTSK